MNTEELFVADLAREIRRTLNEAGIQSADVGGTLLPNNRAGQISRMSLANVDDPAKIDSELTDRIKDLFVSYRDYSVERQTAITIRIRPDAWSADVLESESESLYPSFFRPLVIDVQPSEAAEMDDETRAQLQVAWEENEHLFMTNPGATENELSELEDALGMPVPGELAALLRLVNGAEVDWDAVEELAAEIDDDTDEEYDEDEWEDEPSSVTRNMDLLSIEQIVDEHAQWVELLAEGTYNGVAFDLGEPGRTQPRLVHPGWIPFAGADGNYLAVDTVPGPNGVAGQVVEFGADMDAGPFVHADSITDLFAGNVYSWVGAQETALHLDKERDLSRDDIPHETQEVRVFDAKDVRVTDLVHASGIKSLVIRNFDQLDLDGIVRLPIQKIHILEGDVDCAPLADHPTLRSLSLENVRVTNAHVLATIPALEQLSVSGDVRLDASGFESPNPSLHQIEFEDGGDHQLIATLAELFPETNYRIAHYEG